MGELILDPIISYVGAISEGRFTYKKFVKLQATIPLNSYGFDINFNCDPSSHDDIALQISVRLLNGYISLNSMEDGIWGKEIRFSSVLTDANQEFEIIVLYEVNQFKIIINNEQHCVFPQRICSKKFTHVSIDGDVSNIKSFSKSICDDLISDQNTGTSLPLTENQFDIGNDSNKPQSCERGVNDKDDVESQTVQVASVAIFHFQRETIKRTNRWNIVILLVVIFGFATCAGYCKPL